MMAKAPGLGADMVMLDLEDAVSDSEKPLARSMAAAAVRQQDWSEAIVVVRVNAWNTAWTVADLIEVVPGAGSRLDGIVLPKVESAAEVLAADLVLGQLEQQAGLAVGHLGIDVQIESAKGLLNLDQIASASARTEALVLGPVDLSASLGMPSLGGGLILEDYPGDYFHYPYMRLLVAGRANGLAVVDGPYVKIRDGEGLREYTKRARALGFDGKWAVHPDQVPVLNEMFSPSQAQFDRALELLDAYRRATESEGRGAAMFADEMIDEASRKAALRVVEIGRRTGMAAQDGSRRL
jgi:citrate lyase subunit beta/citryl-CoA lyase